MNEAAVIATRIRELLAEVADVPLSDVPHNLDFAHDLGVYPLEIDSLDALKFALMVAEEYGLEDPESILGDLPTLDVLVDRIGRKRGM